MNNLEYNCTQTGSLDESAIDKEETDLSNHYLYGSGDDKSDYSYPLVGADGCLYRGNVDSAWSLGCRGQCSDGDAHDEKLKELGKAFDSNPIPGSAYDDKQAFEKHAEIAKTDTDRQIALGVAMVPDSVDKAGDWERSETIQRLSEGYMERLAEGEAKSGVMHADFDDEALTHVENRVLSGTENIGGELYPGGTWVVAKRVNDDRLWKLVENGTLSGFSIGGWVHDSKRYDTDELPEAVEANGTDTAREITDATIEEISLVDSPAVPEAQVLTAKAGGDEFLKADPALTAGTEAAMNYLVEERGHDEHPARELAEYLNRAGKSATASDGSGSWLSRAKSFFSRRSGGSDAGNTTPDDHDMTATEKQGRVLSDANVEKAMALHDIAIDLLDGTDVRQNRLRFTDDVSTDFDVADYAHESEAQKTAEPAESGRDADGDIIESMTDENEIDEFAELVAEKLREDGDNDNEAQTDEKNADSEGEQTDKVDDLAETVEQLAENQQQILERIENAEGASQQKASTSANAGSGTWGKSSPFAPAGGSHE